MDRENWLYSLHIGRITDVRCAHDGEHTEHTQLSRVQINTLVSSCQLLYGLPFSALLQKALPDDLTCVAC